MAGRGPWRLASWVWVVPLLVWGCDDSNGPASQLTPRAVTGIVVNASTGLPIPSAHISIGAASAESGATGEFVLANVARQSQELVATAGGYDERRITLPPTQDQVTVRLIPTVSGGNIQPPPGPPQT